MPMHYFEKPEKFARLHFKRSQQKMFFYLATLNLNITYARMHIKCPEDKLIFMWLVVWKFLIRWFHKNPTEVWKCSDLFCRNYVLNGLLDALYNNYKTEDEGSNKFMVDRFLEFKITDSRTVINQVQELQVMLNDIHTEGMINYLKHKRKEMGIEDLIIRLRIEDDNKIAQGYGSNSIKANVVEHNQASRINKGKFTRGKDSMNDRWFNLGPKGGVFKRKFQGNCYNYDKLGHKATNCRLPRREKAKQGIIDDIT
ncbi:hypothetical protein OSB04_003025 [Centaurea solstitialis]|uniref:Uncharacterized protein n=1 Tax=Centaurea solstitialis TaxID=347529 RepID=A0AA38TUE2_9ASTR|nr:hypothetical protein OSB04_003025 [Centaurea solstitialis]